MIIGVLKETLSNESRVALLPSEIKQLSTENISFQIEHEAGLGACFSDITYEKSGAVLSSNIYEKSDVIIKINPPSNDEIEKLKDGVCLISLINPFINHQIVNKLAKKNISTFCLELIPRSTYAQSMDVLSSQATVAGYKAVLNAANQMPKFFPMLMTPAGTIKPANIWSSRPTSNCYCKQIRGKSRSL